MSASEPTAPCLFFREKSEHLRGGGRSQFRIKNDSAKLISTIRLLNQRNSIFHAGRCSGIFWKIVLLEFLLLLHTNGHQDATWRSSISNLPIISASIVFFQQRRRHHKLRAPAIVAVIFDWMEKILRAGFGERRCLCRGLLRLCSKRLCRTNATIWRFSHFAP